MTTATTKKSKMDRGEILEQRRLRNIESAKRSRDRMKNEPQWMELQMNENKDRIKLLERTVETLTNELTGMDRRKSVKKRGADDRPAWFGEPF